MTLLKLEKVKVVSITIISELSKGKEIEYTDSFLHGIKPLLLTTSWLNEKPLTMSLFSIASAKQHSSNLIFFLPLWLFPYVICIATSEMKNGTSDGNYTWLTFRI